MAVASQTFQKTDAGVQALQNALQEQVNSMQSAYQTVESIRMDVSSHYQGAPATAFLGKIDEWLSSYNQVKGEVDKVDGLLTNANSVIDGATNDASGQAGGWSPNSNLVFGGLTGS